VCCVQFILLVVFEIVLCIRDARMHTAGMDAAALIAANSSSVAVADAAAAVLVAADQSLTFRSACTPLIMATACWVPIAALVARSQYRHRMETYSYQIARPVLYSH
jgi:hypothetical protein